MRLDPNNPQDREFLEKHGLLKTYLDASKETGQKINKSLDIEEKKKRPKYGSTETYALGKKFDSKKESQRYIVLYARLKAGLISDLELQKKFSLDVNEVHICNYMADFVYKDKEGSIIVEDVKSDITAAKDIYRVKKRLMKAIYDIDIVNIHDVNI